MLISFTTEDRKRYRLALRNKDNWRLDEILICIEQQYPFFDYGLIDYKYKLGF